ncbi:MAG: hypothetical protein AB7U20_02645 [Planctomycetaceae bacterium]
MRLLWLAYERPPHPDAVCHPASEEEAEFVLALLRRNYGERARLTEQLVRFLAEETRRNAVDRRSVACRTPSGLYRCVPWRLAKWLRHVLPATESAVQRTIARIEQWRRHGSGESDIVSPIP